MEEEIVQQVESVVVDEPRYHLIPKMPKTIAKAINDVMKDIKTLQKNSENKFQNYNYVDIDSFLKAVNPLCAQHGAQSLPSPLNPAHLPPRKLALKVAAARRTSRWRPRSRRAPRLLLLWRGALFAPGFGRKGRRQLLAPLLGRGSGYRCSSERGASPLAAMTMSAVRDDHRCSTTAEPNV